MALEVTIQTMENYGAQTAPGEKVYNYWKFKGGPTVIVTGTDNRTANAVALVTRKYCSTTCSFISYVSNVEIVADPTPEQIAQGFIPEVDSWESGDWEYSPRVEVEVFDPMDIPQPDDVGA